VIVVQERGEEGSGKDSLSRLKRILKWAKDLIEKGVACF